MIRGVSGRVPTAGFLRTWHAAQGKCTMPVTRQIGSPVMRTRLAEAALVVLVLVAAAVAYWFFR